MTSRRDSIVGAALFCALGLVVLATFSATHVAFSAAVAALLVALLLLALRRRVDAPVARGAALLLRWFPLFFVPACVGIIDLGATVRGVWPIVAAILVVSTAIGLGAGLLCGTLLERRA